MATTAQSPNDLTRQQLDELDDLLQRMLSMPLSPPESFANPPPAQAYAPLPTPAPAPVPAPVPVVREVPAPAPRVYAPRAPEPVAPAPAWQPPQPEPATLPLAAPAFEWPDPSTATARPSAPADVPSPQEPVSFLFAPLVLFNAVLNWFLGLFGLPGRVLRSGFVKTLFGLAGLGLLVYTGLKVAQIHGLVALPQELPWPPS